MATRKTSSDGSEDLRPRAQDGAGMTQALGQEVKSALARWVLRKRLAARDTVSADPHDEATHDVDEAFDADPSLRRRFAEDYTFVAVQRDCAVVLRLERLAGRQRPPASPDEERWPFRLWVGIFEGGERGHVYVLGPEHQRVRGEGHDRWRAGGLELDCVRPFERWQVRFVGRLRGTDAGEPSPRCSVDLTFVADAGPHWPGFDDDPDLVARNFGAASWDVGLLRGVRRKLAGHGVRGYVQPGTVIGTVALGDALLPIRAPCLRQHHWGIRDWGATSAAYQCFFALDDGRRGFVHHARLDFLTLEGGFVESAPGRRSKVTRIGATLERRPDRVPVRGSMHLEHGTSRLGLELSVRSDSSLDLEGRARLDFAWCRAETDGGIGGQGLWVQLVPTPGRPTSA